MSNENKARQGEAVAYVLFRDGAVCYEADDNIVISNVPGDETDLYKWRPVYTAPPASADAVPVPRELLKEATDELAYFDKARIKDDKFGLRTTPPRVARLLSKLRALLAQSESKGVDP